MATMVSAVFAIAMMMVAVSATSTTHCRTDATGKCEAPDSDQTNMLQSRVLVDPIEAPVEQADGVALELKNDEEDAAVSEGRRRRRRRRRKRLGLNVKKKLKKLRRKAASKLRSATKVVKSATSTALSAAKSAIPMDKLKSIGASAVATLNAIKSRLSSLAADALEAVENLGTLIVDAALTVGDGLNAALDALKNLFDFSCFDIKVMMCRVILPSSIFDCKAGSGVSMSVGSTPTATLTMVPKVLSRLFSVKTSTKGFTKSTGNSLGGINARSSNDPDLTKMLMPISGSALSIGVDAALEFTPTMTVEISPTTPSATITVSGSLFASLNMLAVATGSATYDHSVMLPQKPISFTVCSGLFCVILNMQGQAKMKVTAAGTGSAGIKSMAEFTVEAVVTLDLSSGKMTQQVTLGELDHEEELDMDASFSGSVRLSMGPLLSIVPLPGAPINIEPLLALELKAHAQASDPWDDETGETECETCAAAKVNFLATTKVTALGIPEDLSFSSTELKNSFIDGMTAMPINLVTAIEETISDCFAGASDAVVSAITTPLKKAAETVTGAAKDLIPDFDFSFPLPTSLVDEETCTTLVSQNLPDGGTCGAVNLGCG